MDAHFDVALVRAKSNPNPGIKNRIVLSIKSIAPSFIQEPYSVAAGTSRPNPDVWIEQDPSAAIFKFNRYLHGLRPINLHGLRMLFGDRRQ